MLIRDRERVTDDDIQKRGKILDNIHTTMLDLRDGLFVNNGLNDVALVFS